MQTEVFLLNGISVTFVLEANSLVVVNTHYNIMERAKVAIFMMYCIARKFGRLTVFAAVNLSRSQSARGNTRTLQLIHKQMTYTQNRS